MTFYGFLVLTSYGVMVMTSYGVLVLDFIGDLDKKKRRFCKKYRTTYLLYLIFS